MKWLVVTICLQSWAMVFGDDRAGRHSASDLHAMRTVFGDGFLSENVEAVRKKSARLDDASRYTFLLQWVLPGQTQNEFRLNGQFVSGESSSATDSETSKLTSTPESTIVAPIFDLVDQAKRLGRLGELKSLIENLHVDEDDIGQKRAKATVQFLVARADDDADAAIRSLKVLYDLFANNPRNASTDRWPEALVLERGIDYLPVNDLIRDLLELMSERFVSNTQQWRTTGNRRWAVSFRSQAGRWKLLKAKSMARLGDSDSRLPYWKPATMATARSRGLGFPQPSWGVHGKSRLNQIASGSRGSDGPFVEKLFGHDDDYLFYTIPLVGNFEIECDLTPYRWHAMTFLVGGQSLLPASDRSALNVLGVSGRDPRRVELAAPLHQADAWAHYRVVVRNRSCTVFLNGREVHSGLINTAAAPWLAFRCSATNHGAARDLRISGSPDVPKQVWLAAGQGLPGWFSYFEEANVEWHQHTSRDHWPGIISSCPTPSDNSQQESLLQYYRPMMEDGTIEYEFYYEPGIASVHPALGRTAFLIDPSGVALHRVTNGKYERSDLDPANRIEVPAASQPRKSGLSPLRIGDWNTLGLTLTGDTVRLSLNGHRIDQHVLSPDADRTFGLFHYADQSEVRVRNLVWRGDWPTQLPSAHQQQLRDQLAGRIDAGLDRLTEVFHHDFSRDGVPSQKFAINGTDPNSKVDGGPSGLEVTRPCKVKGYADTSIAPLVRVHGDFDIVATFADFSCRSFMSGTGTIALGTITQTPKPTHCRMVRGINYDGGKIVMPFARSEVHQYREGGFLAAHAGIIPEEGSSGKLRIARRGDVVYSLFAESDSSQYRVLHSETVDNSDIPRKGVLLLAQMVSKTGGDNEVSVNWKSLTIRAERISERPVDNPEALLKELNRNRETLADRLELEVADTIDEQKEFHQLGNGGTPIAEGFQVVARGTNNWTSSGVGFKTRVRGDFDASVSFDIAKVENPVEGQSSAVYLRTRLPGEPVTSADVVLVRDSKGNQTVIVELVTFGPAGPQGRRLARVPVESAGHLRIARCGSRLAFLFAEPKSTAYRVLAETDAGTIDLPPEAIHFEAHAGGDGRDMVVVVKNLEVRADRLLDKALPIRSKD